MNSYTRMVDDSQSSPDVSLTNNLLLPALKWKVKTALNSDHLPNTIMLSRSVFKITSENKTTTNFNKADSSQFHNLHWRYLWEHFFPNRCFMRREDFSGMVNKACSHPSRQNSRKQYSFSIYRSSADERDALHSLNSSDAITGVLNNHISKLVNDSKKRKWEMHLNDAHFGTGNFWKTIKSFNNPH